MLTDILSQSTAMPTREVQNDMPVAPNHVYVIPPGTNMVITGGVLQLSPRTETRGQFRPIDVFLRSLAHDRKHASIGVILSGGATDGTLGLEEIKAEGGITFAQDSSAIHDSMPRSAIAAGCVDFVLPPEEIAKEIARIARHPYVAPVDEVPIEEASGSDLKKVFELLRHNSGVDFTHYKRNTLFRRLTRRMVLHRLDGLKEYARFLQEMPSELEALYQDVLINVTSFFRNPECFDLLKTKVFPALTNQRSRHEPVRIWVIGCSTGEEAYSIAIAFVEYLEAAAKQVVLNVFATDLNAVGVERARLGLYPKTIAQDVSPERLRRFFSEVDGKYRVNKSLRDMVVFARHNVLADPPFSRIELISCRNLLIYLEPGLQQRIIPTLHYALQPNGYLWLGSSETIGTYRDLFESEDARQKLYTRKPGGARTAPNLQWRTRGQDFHALAPRPALAADVVTGATETYKEADRILLSRYAPPGVVINGDLDIVQFRGDTGLFLTPAPGKASLNLLKMLREGLLVGVRSAVHKAKREKIPVREEGLRVRSNGAYRTVDVEVIPLKANGGDASFLVMFVERHHAGAARPKPPRATKKAKQEDEAEVETRLKRELAATREYLQAVIEQQEAANEELQSANEEVQSSNEELQSINEELETSKEEIQSSNEELATVNDELHSRNLELSQSNNDLLNLIHSVQMPIVMLGSDLRIRRFTPAAEKMLNLIATDVGRPMRDIKLTIGATNLEEKLIKAIDTVTVIEEEVQDAAGHWFLLRIRPYRTLEDRIEGALMLLVDIDTLKRNQEELRRQANLLQQAHEPIFVWDYSGPVTYWNHAAEECYGYTRDHALGRARSELLQSDVPADFFRTALHDAGQWSGELTHTGRNGEQIVVDARMVLVSEPSGKLVLETHHPITQRKRMEQELRTRAVELAALDQRKNEFLAILAHELRNPLAPLSTGLHLIKEQIADGASRVETVKIMERQLRRLTQLVDDLLDISRITRGRIELRLEPIDLSSFLPEVVQGAQSVVNARDQELILSVPKHPLVIEGDPARLEQIFGNLLNNASKFSGRGSRINLSAQADMKRRQAVVSVTDAGVGIATEDLPNVFNLFTQVNPSMSRNTGGLGIGLNLAQELAHLHRGAITAHSAGLNQGSEFIVRLPLLRHAPTPPSQEPQRAHGDRTRRVLVVDDNQDAARSLAEILSLSGHDVSVQTTSKGALETIDGFRPDAIVLDLGLPSMDGFEVARRLRELPDGQRFLLIALSGYGQEEHRRHSREAGFDHHLTKPADLAVLLELLGSAVTDASAR